MSHLYELPLNLLAVGAPLNYDLRSRNDVLLIKKGFAIKDTEQIEAILKAGPCVGPEDAFKLGLIETLEATPTPVFMPNIKHKPSKKDLRPFDTVAEWITKTNLLYGQQLSLAHRVESISEDILKHVSIFPEAASAAIFLVPFKQYTAAHAVHCAIYCAIIAEQQGVAEMDRLALIKAALLMNISIARLQDTLFSVSQSIAHNCREKLNQHPELSATLAKEHGIDCELTLTIIRQHHEKPDGTGYPSQLVENKIHQLSKILHIVDIILAKITHRVYRKPIAPKKALGSMLATYKDLESQKVIKYLIKSLGVYPPGTVVRNAEGETLIISQKSDVFIEMWAVFRSDGMAIPSPLKRRIDLSRQHELHVVPYTDINKIINLNALFGYG